MSGLIATAHWSGAPGVVYGLVTQNSKLSSWSTCSFILWKYAVSRTPKSQPHISLLPFFFLQGEVGDQGRPGAPAYSPHPSLAKGLYVISPACLYYMYILSCYRQSHELARKIYLKKTKQTKDG